jgi:formylmethanofuran dehydrogenase subunit E
MRDLQALINACAARHSHLCPRQVLGIRAGLAGADFHQLETPRKDKRLLVIIETDGCFADGIEVATGASIGKRTLRVEDYGKIACTVVDTRTEKAIRISTRLNVRLRAWDYSPEEDRRYYAQLHSYQVMPADELFNFQAVQLKVPLERTISQPGKRTTCVQCGEDIINEREVPRDGLVLCRACAGFSYYFLQDNHPDWQHADHHTGAKTDPPLP